MVLAIHWLYYTHTNLQSKDYPVCGPLIWTRTRGTDANVKSDEDPNSLCALKRTVDFFDVMEGDEKLEGGCGPPIWSKCAVTYRDAGHFGGSDSWYSDPLTRLWIRIHHHCHGRMMKKALEDHQPVLPCFLKIFPKMFSIFYFHFEFLLWDETIP